MNEKITVALAQIAPVWLNKEATIDKVIDSIKQAAEKSSDLVCFGESLLPGYPFWVENTGGAKFNDDFQKSLFAYYSSQAVNIKAGDLSSIQAACKHHNIACYLGIIERAHDRSGHSLYCSLIYIDKNGAIGSNHRKLVPTYEERLVWSNGDGHGLRTHALEAFTLGGLNCWENWLPLARTSLYAQGEDLHVAVWPGGDHNTHDITRFVAKESRSYAVSVSGFLIKEQIPKDLPFYDKIIDLMPDSMANGASCVAKPNGEWLLEPQVGKEGIFIVEIDHHEVRKERSLIDVTGHYSRPDVTQLIVNRQRQTIAEFED
ncbi:carbon-nitrogen hydrolase family protein [Kangiella sp. HZ709]|uniref:carbon-nitrogen hydrolase family protein n=1 Tax=Kangiella sp. HZ709 TaxID=2666328 RepID=UPI0012AFD43F|nr:carbon-nitrogen hydrolase family protein [Kangiella sp. HZ709]MRX26691.1 carbon-nitrogen hydrolase family protein [Kangiella sp. HZ709]